MVHGKYCTHVFEKEISIERKRLEDDMKGNDKRHNSGKNLEKSKPMYFGKIEYYTDIFGHVTQIKASNGIFEIRKTLLRSGHTI